MTTYLPIFGAALAGLFTLVSAYFVWTLKKRDENRAIESSARAEKISHFIDIYSLFETAIFQIKNCVEYSLQSDFIKMNAKIELLADEELRSKYFDCCNRLEDWSKYHASGQRPTQQIGDAVVTTFQSPDPREKYRKLAGEQYDKLVRELGSLKDMLKARLN